MLLSYPIDQLVDIDTFATVLKTISDATRYNVLLELTKPHAKSKQIAEKLDIR